MMYDFNLAEGDVFWHGTDDTGAPHSLFVHRISTVHLADSIPRRRIHLRYYDHVFGKIWDEDTSIWIEGIGDARHGILAQRFTWSFSNVREADKLICYKNDDGLIFDSPNYDGCFFEQIISATREVSDIKVNIYPNPSTDNFYLSFPDQEPIDRLVIYDSRGRGVYRAVNIPTTDSWRVDAADWPAGVYFMRMFQRGRVATAKLVRVE